MTKLPADILAHANRLEAESPQAMVAVFLPTGQYVYASANHESLISYQPEQLLQKRLMQLIAPQDLPHAQLGFMDALLHGKSIAISLHLVHKSGRLVPVKAEAWNAIDPDTGTGFIIGRATPVGTGTK